MQSTVFVVAPMADSDIHGTQGWTMAMHGPRTDSLQLQCLATASSVPRRWPYWLESCLGVCRAGTRKLTAAATGG